MRVACIGNMNNNLFTLTRYLRDRNVDAELLLLDSEYDHFQPSADTFDTSIDSFIKVLPWGDRRRIHAVSPEVIRQSLASYDKIICCDVVPAFLAKSGRSADIFVPHGSDLFAYPFPTVKDVVLLNPARLRFAALQRRGIQEARHVFMGEKGTGLDAPLRRLGVESRTSFVPLPMVYTPEFHPDRLSLLSGRSTFAGRFQQIRATHDLVVFHHTRHFWSFRPRTPWNRKRLRYHYKGNDRLVRAFARFVQENPDVRAALVLFEYGLDAPATKQLVSDLAIDRHVVWMPLMERKEIMLGLSMADIGTGEFIGGWYSAGVVYKNLALGKPLLHYCSLADPGIYPFVNVRTEDDILGALRDWRKDPERFRRLGEAGTAWHQREIIDRAMSSYIKALTA